MVPATWGRSWPTNLRPRGCALALGRVLDKGRLTIQELEELCPGVNRRTLQRDLKTMVDKGLLVEQGTGPTDPTRHYSLAEAFLRPGGEL